MQRFFSLLFRGMQCGLLLGVFVGCGVKATNGKFVSSNPANSDVSKEEIHQPDNGPIAQPGQDPVNGPINGPINGPDNPIGEPGKEPIVEPDRTKSDYSPLVKRGSSGYKDVYNPNTSTVYEGGNALLTTSHNDLRLSKIKLFVPPGTRLFTVSFLTYLNDQESKALGRFGNVPTRTAADVTAATMIRNTSNTLERLTRGEELPFYSPGGSGNLGISEPYQFDTFQANQGGYIYLHVLSVPGGIIKTLQTRMTVDEACYRSWYANAKWDSQGNPDENATHTCSGSR